ncbi:FAD-binding protein [Nocardioides sp. Kera G14]|uniref:FAD-binding protein n=1 Tax=Nocardioides sp. Kera G14 TaxID=2884264 RepID=UPI001D0F9F83|nr:FAD-binding protein [Nocardioides sp. Kera G14]UDY22281.1 FAD-binding protein [Nocardioides sp. Kera G14]
MSTEIPEVIDAATVPGWPASVESVDVLVVGFGIAGGSAALEAARAGARVVLLERAATPGGTTAMAGGHFYLGGGTAVQQACGIEDSAEEMEKYLLAIAADGLPTGTDVDPETAAKIHAYCTDSVEHFDWVESLGITFERSFFPGKAVIQPGTEGVMFTGNEKVYPFRDVAKPAPRGHKVPKPGDTGGAVMVIEALADQLEQTNAEIRYETGASNLVVEDGRVVGVAWRRFDERGYLRARSVIITAGGFVGNAEMVAEHVPLLGSGKLFPLASTYDDGLGLRLGKSVGAEWRGMDKGFQTAPFYPPSILMTGIIVNKRGRRFAPEDSYHSRMSAFVLEQDDSEAYLIVDSEHIEMPSMPLTPFLDGYDTVEEMADGIGVPFDALEQTLNDYNKHAAAGEDPEFHKYHDWIAPQDKAPWGVIDLRLGKAMYAGFTMGGMRVDLDGRVQRADGSVIEGLYAGGACAVNIAQDAKGYCSGMQLGEGSYFGRRAGKHAAGAR